MKKLLVLFIIMIFVEKCFSQEIKAGFIGIPHITITSLDFNDRKVSASLLSNIVISTKKTYHNFCYVWGANAFVLVNGWVYHSKGKQDVYLVTTKNFTTSGGNIMIAWEIELANGNAWGAIEFGTSWETWNKPLLNLSLTIPFDVSIWKKKGS